MDRFPSLDEDDFKDLLIERDPALWTQMEQSRLYAHMRLLRSDGTSLGAGRALSEMWFEWWLENDAELSPMLDETDGGKLEDVLTTRYADDFDIFGVGEYSFVKDAARKVPSWMAMHAAWKVRPDVELLRETGEYAGQVILMMADGASFDEADAWTRGQGRFAPSNPSAQVHRYRALVRRGVAPATAMDLLVVNPQRPVWQILLLHEGMPQDYVDAL